MSTQEPKLGYLLFSHGSLLCGAGQALLEHAARLRKRLSAAVEIGYLNYSEPTMEEGIARLIAGGALRIIVLPYFLVPGFFVTKSLPERLDLVKALYPDLQFTVAPALGADDLLADALIDAARRADFNKASWRDVYSDAAANCRNRSDCPLYGTERCPATSGSERVA